ncbi:MAG: GAP family protein [Candidatus Hodarchaeota archaeon]
MNTVLIEAVFLASAGLFSVGSITLTILLLISDRGWINGLSYALGYITGYTSIGLLVVIFQYQTAQNSPQELSIVPYILIILGSLLILLSLRNYRKPAREDNNVNRFLSIVDKITPRMAFGIGVAVTVINFKNLALFLSAMLVVITSNLSLFDKVFITLLVVLVFCMSVIIPVGIYLLFPTNGSKMLGKIKETLNKHSHQISIWAPLIFGLIFVIRGGIEFL